MRTSVHLPEAIAHYPGDDLISRIYWIITERQPVMLINEKFPLQERHMLSGFLEQRVLR
jgi:hypothetical protein